MVDAMRADGVGTRTIQYVHATLRAALEHAYREELVSRNVAKLVRVERPKPAPKEPVSVAEARKMLDGTTDDNWHALWVLLLMLACGAARYAACDGSTSTSKLEHSGRPRRSRAGIELDEALESYRS
ncbi:hypothetical protein ACQPZA_00780 [Pseudonocardia xinjiangensis]|uniref:hypothetical protein n=1 Tax=Pseudonocardia xinjiangensis TaxID=75289 RepID=UPI003D8CF360